MSAYLTDFLHGRTTGMAEVLGWTGLVLLGIALAGLIVVALCALVRYIERHEIKGDYTGDELEPETPTERRRRARFTSLIAVLGLLAVPVIALTR